VYYLCHYSIQLDIDDKESISESQVLHVCTIFASTVSSWTFGYRIASTTCVYYLCLYSIQLDIDDKESISESYEGRRRMATTSYLYFGGLPFRPLDGNVGSAVSYVGCIGDVTVNGE
jgi:hypothetical protein